MYAPPPKEESFDKYDEPRIHMERLLMAKLVEFDISLRILITLEGAGIKTLGDLIKQNPESLRRINRIGANAVEILSKLLERYDLKWGE